MDNKLLIAMLERIEETANSTNRKVDDWRQESNRQVDSLRSHFNDELGEIRKDQTEIRKSQAESASVQAKQQVILEEHMRRTELNEQALVDQKEYHEKSLTALKTEISPLKTHVAMWGGAFKALMVIGAIVSLIAGAIKLFQ